ncbi:phosphotransferase enzyme family protein [Neobacillus niacini]|uniref:phosphotransferase enzyme family protein n=1 Tax=Neobacillus niacini TaxID=86668 RepID=UPI002041C11E|nr:phosphotransferase [Neobacillus niacini]MCM3691267.1 phosphotransferase [Neobacillus niacini]
MIRESLIHLYGQIEGELVRINDGFHNTVYTTRHFIFRVTPSSRRKKSDIINELTFIESLWKDGVPVSLPIKSVSERLVEALDDNHYVVAFEKAKGTPIDVTISDVWNQELYFYWGNLLGKIHSAGKKIKVDRPIWTADHPDLLNLFPEISSESIANTYKQLLKQLVTFPQTPDLFGLIHNDFHQGNIFVNEGNLTVFDFDDCAYHWFAYDLATAFYHAYWQTSSYTPENTNFSREFWEHFLRGYQQEHKISKELIQQIPIFLKIREIFLYILFLEKWDLKNLQDWQAYTLTDLKNNIESRKSYSDVNFTEMIDNFGSGKIQ